MRLVKFIETYNATIVAEVVSYARTLPPLAHEPEATLSDHVPKILEAVVRDLRQSQTEGDSRAKALGEAPVVEGAPDTAAQTHGRLRARNGLQTTQLIAEYRALRASVLRLWADTEPEHVSVQEVIRFNEAIDQAIAESVEYFSNEMDQLRDIFLGVLGHDLRGPLNAILLTSELISRLAKDPAISGHLGILIQSGRRMASLLDTLLQYNRSSLGHGMIVHRRRVDLALECAAEVEVLKAALPGAVLSFDFRGDTTADVDASAIREALGNLVHNAAKYGDDAPIVIELFGTAEAAIVLAVANEGPEIPVSQIVRMFEPLQRGTQGGEDSRTSLGLGLFIVEQIAQAHGGRIGCVSSPARTVFELTIPRHVIPAGSGDGTVDAAAASIGSAG
jgi:signal transduction histidine kinase